MTFVLLYESADDVLPKAREHFEAHRARMQTFQDAGTLLAAGPFADPQRDGSMSLFTTKEAALEFVASDPFVLNGVVRGWRLLEWNSALE